MSLSTSLSGGNALVRRCMGQMYCADIGGQGRVRSVRPLIRLFLLMALAAPVTTADARVVPLSDPMACLVDASAPISGCTSVQALAGLEALATSPDGKNVYAY